MPKASHSYELYYWRDVYFLRLMSWCHDAHDPCSSSLLLLSSSSSHYVLLSVAPWNYVMVACRVAWILLQPQVAFYSALAAFFLFSLVLLPGLRYIHIFHIFSKLGVDLRILVQNIVVNVQCYSRSFSTPLHCCSPAKAFCGNLLSNLHWGQRTEIKITCSRCPSTLFLWWVIEAVRLLQFLDAGF